MRSLNNVFTFKKIARMIFLVGKTVLKWQWLHLSWILRREGSSAHPVSPSRHQVWLRVSYRLQWAGLRGDSEAQRFALTIHSHHCTRLMTSSRLNFWEIWKVRHIAIDDLMCGSAQQPSPLTAAGAAGPRGPPAVAGRRPGHDSATTLRPATEAWSAGGCSRSLQTAFECQNKRKDM